MTTAELVRAHLPEQMMRQTVDHESVVWSDVRWTAYLIHQHFHYDYPGQISDLPNVVGVDAGRAVLAERAAGLWGGGGHLSGNRLLIRTQSQQMKARRIGQNRRLGHGTPPEHAVRKGA